MNIIKSINEQVKKIYRSIAFIPFLIILLFLVLTVAMIYLDYSAAGKTIKESASWIRLKDPSTARSLVSVVAAGLISITVFSFSMVMVVLNQAASQLTNRVLENLIGSRLQQFILGFYIGTIVFSLFLLTSIRNNETGIYVPALSTYLLILLSVIAIFLFVFFLHFVTQSIKYVVIIQRICNQTMKALKNSCCLHREPVIAKGIKGLPLYPNRPGIFESFNQKLLVKLAKEQHAVISFNVAPGNFVLCSTPLAAVQLPGDQLTKETTDQLLLGINIVDEVSISDNYYAGFRQLSEIAVKALSPGINDPGTAVESLRSLAVLLEYRLQHFPHNQLLDENKQVRIITKEKTADELLNDCLLPIWDYGKNDRNIQDQLALLLTQLSQVTDSIAIRKLQAQIQIQKLKRDI